ncbi:MAG: hypothetical protein IKN83_08655 [Bacteroidaceae bacterium]|nr:hypothetical protein [Bacteroidaceae bacterium]
MLLFSCGQDKSNSQEAANDLAASIPTDGLLKEWPKLIYEQEVYKAQVKKKEQEIRESGEKEEKIRQELEITWREEKEFKEANLNRQKEVRKELEGVEIPGEVEEGVPFKLTTNYVFHLNSLRAEGEYTANVSEEESWSDYTLEVLDTDGNIIFVSEQVFFTDDGRKRTAGTKGYSPVIPSINGSTAEGWAKVAKVVIKRGTKQERDEIKAQLKEKFEAFRQSLK